MRPFPVTPAMVRQLPKTIVPLTHYIVISPLVAFKETIAATLLNQRLQPIAPPVIPAVAAIYLAIAMVKSRSHPI